eukprot:COSAG02_NODE_3000_length_7578_cov_218.918305_6_plen_1156_part_00
MNRKKRQDRNYVGALELVQRCLEFVRILQPSRGFVIENPRGGDLGAFPVLATVKRNAFDYCCFGAFPKKPTTLWNDLHHLHDQRCDGQRPESHHTSGKHRYRIRDTLRGEAAAVIPPALAERVYDAVCKQAQTSERRLMGVVVNPGLSPFDNGWKEQQRAGGCDNPCWRTNQGSLTIPVAQRRQCDQLRALAKRIDEQPWRSERIAQICGEFHPVQSTMVCWAFWNSKWQPGRLCDFSDLPDSGKGADRTSLDNVLDLAKGERQHDGKLLVNWLYEGTVSLVSSQNVRHIGDIRIDLPEPPVYKKSREALRQAKILAANNCLLQRHELQDLLPGQKLLLQYLLRPMFVKQPETISSSCKVLLLGVYIDIGWCRYNGVFDDQIDEQHNEWFELQLIRHIHSEDTTACVWELDVVNVTQSGRRQKMSHREHPDSVAHSSVLDPLDLDESAGQGRLRRWFDWDNENGTIGALCPETVGQVPESSTALTLDLDGKADSARASNASKCKSPDELSAKPGEPRVVSASLLVGLRVRVLFSSSGWHLGVVQKLLVSGKLLVEFEDCEKREYTGTKVRSALVDRLLFQRVNVPFNVSRDGRTQVFEGTVMTGRDGKYKVEYDDGQKIDGYSTEELSEYTTGRYAEIDQQQKQHQDQAQEQQAQRSRRRQRAAPRRFEAGPASRSRAAGVSYVVPVDPFPVKRRRKTGTRCDQGQADLSARPTTPMSQCADDPLLGDKWSDEDELAEIDRLARSKKRFGSCSCIAKAQNVGQTVSNIQKHSQQQKPRVEADIRPDAVNTAIGAGVRTSIGCVKQGDILSVRWDDRRWYAALVVYASTKRGIGLQYPESEHYKPCEEVLWDFDKEVTPDRVRRCETLDEASQQGKQPSLPINSSRIPRVGDRVEVEYNEADDANPVYVIHEGLCIQAAKRAKNVNAEAQRLGYASARLPTQFKVEFPSGDVDTIKRGKHRWRRISAESTEACSTSTMSESHTDCCAEIDQQQKQHQDQAQEYAGHTTVMSQFADVAPLGEECSNEDHDHLSQQQLQLSQDMRQRNQRSHCDLAEVDELSDDSTVAKAKIPINSSRIPRVGDRVEVEYNEADDANPVYVIHEGLCIQAAKRAKNVNAEAQRLGYASARLPTQFKVEFPSGDVDTIKRGKHRWRKVV